jgi:hypothetical protein
LDKNSLKLQQKMKDIEEQYKIAKEEEKRELKNKISNDNVVASESEEESDIIITHKVIQWNWIKERFF